MELPARRGTRVLGFHRKANKARRTLACLADSLSDRGHVHICYSARQLERLSERSGVFEAAFCCRQGGAVEKKLKRNSWRGKSGGVRKVAAAAAGVGGGSLKLPWHTKTFSYLSLSFSETRSAAEIKPLTESPPAVDSADRIRFNAALSPALREKVRNGCLTARHRRPSLCLAADQK